MKETRNPNVDHETLDVAEEILDRYNVPGPRYTSYPTAPEWTGDFTAKDYEASLDASNQARPRRPLSLYMHLPFCERLCLFCGCNVVIKKNHEAALPYIEALVRETGRLADNLDTSRPVVQFHWGGGTPTYLACGQLDELFAAVQRRFTFDPQAEIGVEVDPRVTTPEHVRTLRRLGFNRISMGVQDFTPFVQQTVKRVQSYESTRDLFNLCREQSFESINIDLIYGLPHQTPETFVRSVERVIGLRPDRVAMFSYAHVPWLKKQQGSFAAHIPQGMDKFRIFRAGIEHIIRAGYVYIGFDHFALPGDELCLAQASRTLHRNFQGYTTKAGADLIGLGVSSISGLETVYAQNHRQLDDYYAAIAKGGLPIMRGMRLGPDDLLRRAVIGRLLCHCVLHKREIEAEFDLAFDDYFAGELGRLKQLEEDGLVTLSAETIGVTPLGRIFLRNIGMAFDRYLREPKNRPVFSRTL